MTHSKAAKSQAHTSSKPPTKISAVINLLMRKNGATLSDIIKATGWQQHSVRAALTGLRKTGHTIERTSQGSVSCYRIVKAGQ